MKNLMTASLSFALFMAAQGLWAEDTPDGKALYTENCTSCHVQMTGGDGSTIFTRKDRKVNSMDSLKTQILRCATAKNLSWFDEDVDAVAAYLNESYYKLDGKPDSK